MDWLHKLRRALLALSARLKLRKSVVGHVGGECGGIGGLLKLQDDVQMCGYQDVQIMWNILSRAQQEEMIMAAAATTTTTTRSPPKHKKKRRQQQQTFWSSKAFFWTSHVKSPVLVRSDACSVEEAKY